MKRITLPLLYSFLKTVILFSCCIFLLPACTAKKKITSKPAQQQPVPVVDKRKSERDETLKNILAHQVGFNFLSIKVKADAESNDGKKYHLTFNLRIKKNELIWVSVSALAGIEVARILMTPDSIRVIDRVNNRYLRNDFSYVSQLLNVQVDFNTVQSLLVGNFPVAITDDQTEMVYSTDEIMLEGTRRQAAYSVRINKENLKLKGIELSDSLAMQRFQVDYTSFQTINDKVFPQLITIMTKSDKSGLNMQLDYSKVQVEENLSFPFNAPKRFN